MGGLSGKLCLHPEALRGHSRLISKLGCGHGGEGPLPGRKMAKHPVIQHLPGGHLTGQKEIPKSAHKPLGAAKEATALCGEAGTGHRCLAMFP